ncbi:MAG: T9SS type A sorting domain-containing protein [Balneolales bacterium]|nr:T9SS type A sorting domain-containing protein [Balneolales bacterium]
MIRLATILQLLVLISFTSIANAQDSNDPVLLHYWSFNNVNSFETPDVTIGNGELIANLVGNTEITTGTGQDFVGENARNNDTAGAHLRFNNPIGSRLTFSVPTSGYDNIVFKYETRRSGSGADTQFITYTTDGTSYNALRILEVTETPTVITLDFSDFPEVNDNPDFSIRFEFNDTTDPPNLAGNNRFDNVTVDGIPLDGTNLPPFLVNTVDLKEIVAKESISIRDLIESLFEDPEDDELTFTFNVDKSDVAGVAQSGDDIRLEGRIAGETLLTVSASDGENLPVSTTIRVLVYPDPFFAEAAVNDNFYYMFDEWSEDEPEGSFPDHMLFLQSNISDPGAYDDLLYAYQIPEAEYAAEDAGNVGFPYKNSARSRINGLGADGISLINTGRDRDLGGVLISADINKSEFYTLVTFEASTLRANSRVYGLRLQHRTVRKDGDTGYVFSEWKDAMVGSQIVEYERSEVIDELSSSEYPHYFSVESDEHVQFLLRYYYTGERLSETSGARDMIRLASFNISKVPVNSIEEPTALPSVVVLDQNYPNPFNPSTTIGFSLPESQHINLTVFDILGRKISTLVEEVLPAGQHSVNLDASNLSSGLYIYRLQTQNGTISRTMSLIK